jgi:hypothetical protein
MHADIAECRQDWKEKQNRIFAGKRMLKGRVSTRFSTLFKTNFNNINLLQKGSF